MHFSVLPPWAAPVSTGHPFGLPETSAQTKSVTRVTAVTQQSSSDTDMMQEKSPTQFWRAAGGEPDPTTHVAPPSIIQLKISAMLTKQAEFPPGQGPEGEQDVEAGKEVSGNDEDTAEIDGESEALPAEPRRDATASGYKQLPELPQPETRSSTTTSADASDRSHTAFTTLPAEQPAQRLSYA
ncbi:hypothetical protein [Puniceibacterium sediminis]|uniref:Uncharacterized protein n=1 Tax=Puniceibacterium sediminis TaxID=1608407 RepID=A0A238V0S2_9RHOB|nr:hypothetical protein [Puniceibacterium sediminis]SNR27866.1 hypothetical protein SAMN06265370_101440 [Puniceibacterium sediminis]